MASAGAAWVGDFNNGMRFRHERSFGEADDAWTFVSGEVEAGEGQQGKQSKHGKNGLGESEDCRAGRTGNVRFGYVVECSADTVKSPSSSGDFLA